MLVLKETLNQSKLKMLARMIMRPVKSETCPLAMQGKAVLTVPLITRKDRRAYKHMTSVPRFPRRLRKSWVMKRMSD